MAEVPQLTSIETSKQNPVVDEEKFPEGKIILEKWSLPIIYVPRADNTECSICKNKLTEPSITMCNSQQTNFSSTCTVSLGKCGHAFHTDCINKWNQNVDTCPIDNSTWVELTNDITESNWMNFLIHPNPMYN